jgi:hypothetical protein
MSWECNVCGKKNPDKADLCKRKYRRDDCFGYNPDADFRFVRKYIAFLTLMSDFQEGLNSGIVKQ